MLTERKLTERELDNRKVVLQGLLKNKQNLVKKYGKDAEKVMYGIATKKAKSKVEEMNKEKIKELIYKALTREDNDPSGANLEGDPNEYVVGEGHGLERDDVDLLKYMISQLKSGGNLSMDVGARRDMVRLLNNIIKTNIKPGDLKEDIADADYAKGIEVVKDTLSKEGGAAGLDPIVKELQKLGFKKDDVIKLLKDMVRVKKHRDGDYILLPLEEDTNEVSMSAAAGPYLTPYAFRKKKKKKEVDEGTCGYDRDVKGKKLKGPGGLGERYTKPGLYRKKLAKAPKADKMVSKQKMKLPSGMVSYMDFTEHMFEKLTKKSDVGDFVDDFQKSDAKQFKGKSDKKKKQMAVAAYLSKQNGK